VICKRCYSELVAPFPADIRLYLNRSRTVSAAPLNPPPEIAVCLDCGFSEFVVSSRWLSAGWLRPFRETPAAMVRELARTAQRHEEAIAETKKPEAQPAAETIDPNRLDEATAEQQDETPELVSESGCRRTPFQRGRLGLLR
jgi:RNase P subunit RPR2